MSGSPPPPSDQSKTPRRPGGLAALLVVVLLGAGLPLLSAALTNGLSGSYQRHSRALEANETARRLSVEILNSTEALARSLDTPERNAQLAIVTREFKRLISRIDRLESQDPDHIINALPNLYLLANNLLTTTDRQGRTAAALLDQPQISALVFTDLEYAFGRRIGYHRTAMRDWVKTFLIVNSVLGSAGLLLIAGYAVWSLRRMKRLLDKRNADLAAAGRENHSALYFDRVTGLPNRQYLMEHLGKHEEGKTTTGLLSLDLLRFREINDTLGPEIGDKVLQLVASCLTRHARPGETAARTGSNTFVLATSQRTGHGELATLAEQICADVKQQSEFLSYKINLTPVIGIARSSGGCTRSLEALMADCEIALTRAKIEEGIVHYNPRMRKELSERRRIASELRTALREEQIEPFFQPQVDARTGQILGFEALARWRHPELGLLGPNAFLSVVEASNLGAGMTQIIVRKALSSIGQWQAAGLPTGRVGLNFFVGDMRQADFASKLLFDVDRAGLTPDDMSVELLESALIEGPEDPIIETINTLSHSGFHIDLDDFGTGHASMSNLQLLEIDRIKIDRVFVTGLHLAPQRRKMAEAMIRLAQTLGIDALAEGVECEEERALLADLGCTALQGFGIAQPMAAETVPSWIAAYSKRVEKGAVIAA